MVVGEVGVAIVRYFMCYVVAFENPLRPEIRNYFAGELMEQGLYSRTSLIDPLSLLLAVPSRRSSTGISGGYEHPLRCSPRLDIDTVVYYNALTANSFYIRGGLFPCVITISELYILTKNPSTRVSSTMNVFSSCGNVTILLVLPHPPLPAKYSSI